ncbi:MAG TPA: DUF805 domain-containing protein [Asticcacaulis sp.]|nr:DUF805 domain-containing protein [Asticcacaulis sp.]
MLMFQPLLKYADFGGRARRTEFWLWVLFQKLLSYAALAVMGFISPQPFFDPAHQQNPEIYLRQSAIYYAPLLVIGLLLFIPSLAVQVRRLHDSNRSGWWVILPLAILLLGGTVAAAWFTSQFHGKALPETIVPQIFIVMAIVYVPALLAVLLLFIFNLLDGTAGRNRFGPDPKGRDHIEAF